MKMLRVYIYLILSTTLFLSTGFSQEPFITQWKTDNPGNICNSCIGIPTKGDGYSYQVDWGDGGGYDTTFYSGNAFHNYSSPGIYDVKIKGDFPRIVFRESQIDSFNSIHKIVDVLQWGDIAWTSMEDAFYACDSLIISALDAPDLSNVTDASNMFAKCRKLNSDLNTWDVSQIKDMGNMFSNAINFEGNISSWDVSNVTHMAQMFWKTEKDLELSSWDVSSVTNMNAMFYQNSNFKGDLSSWDVSNVVRTDAMFRGCSKFNSDLSDWDVSNITDMTAMFDKCQSFNSDLSSWDVSSVTKMNSLFEGCKVFSSDLSLWDVSNVTNFTNLFNGALVFESDLSQWDVSNVANMNSTFRKTEKFSSDLSSWDVSNVTNMAAMFLHASEFNSDLSQWDVANVTRMSSMFAFTDLFNSHLEDWNVSNNSDFTRMFQIAASFDQDLGTWDLSAVQDSLGEMLEGSGMSTANYENTLKGWAVNPNTPDDIILESGNLTYCDESGRNQLIEKGWDIRYDSKLTEDEGCLTSSTATITTATFRTEIYPNPVSKKLIIKQDGNAKYCRILNVAGQSLVIEKLNEGTTVIDISSLPSGIYIFHSYGANEFTAQHFVKT